MRLPLSPQFFKKVLHGFVLPEILLVMFLIGFMATIGIAVYRGQIQKAYDARRKSDLHKLKLAAEEYEKDYDCYPDTLPSCTSGTNDLEDYIGKIPCDPETLTDYTYESDAAVCHSWFKIYASLKNLNDPIIEDLGCSSGCGPSSLYNFYVSSSNAP